MKLASRQLTWHSRSLSTGRNSRRSFEVRIYAERGRRDDQQLVPLVVDPYHDH